MSYLPGRRYLSPTSIWLCGFSTWCERLLTRDNEIATSRWRHGARFRGRLVRVAWPEENHRRSNPLGRRLKVRGVVISSIYPYMGRRREIRSQDESRRAIERGSRENLKERHITPTRRGIVAAFLFTVFRLR